MSHIQVILSVALLLLVLPIPGPLPQSFVPCANFWMLLYFQTLRIKVQGCAGGLEGMPETSLINRWLKGRCSVCQSSSACRPELWSSSIQQVVSAWFLLRNTEVASWSVSDTPGHLCWITGGNLLALPHWARPASPWVICREKSAQEDSGWHCALWGLLHSQSSSLIIYLG